MARKLVAIEKGLRMFKENSETEFIDFLFGAGAPPGTSGETDEAPIGSSYRDTTNGDQYDKKTATSQASDWVLNGSGTASVGVWRPEEVRAVTNDTLAAGNSDPSTWTDNESGVTHTDFTAGQYVIGDADGTPALFEITSISAPNLVLAAAGTPLAEHDTFVTRYYFPDSPAAQEGQAIVQKSATVMVKIGDVNWDFATGINLSGAYAPTFGQITNADSVEAALQKLDYRNLCVDAGNISSLTVLDSLPVDEFRSAIWIVSAFETANANRVKSRIVHVINDGTGAADATDTQDQVIGRLRDNANFNLQISSGVSGTGAAQVMEIRANTSEAGITVTAQRVAQVKSGY